MTHAVTFTTADAAAFLGKLWALDARLVAAGFHPMSEWWRAQLERFVRALPGGVQRAVIRAGRRAGKSSTISRLAVAWALWGAWHVPAGDIGCVMFVSVSRDEANARLRTISAILDALHIRYSDSDGELEVGGARPVLFRVAACTVRSVVGPTAIMLVGDEVSRWEARESAANPATEVFASLSPTLASQPFGFAFLVSSPWGSDDFHAQRFDEGDSDAQIVAHGATWECNPTISEARTHELERDPRVWSREYAAEPGATVTAAIDRADLEGCFRTLPTNIAARWYAPIDASSLRGDTFAWARVGVTSGGTVIVAAVGGFDGDELRRVSMRDVVKKIADTARPFRAPVLGDQREEAALQSMFAEERTAFTSFAWTEQSKDAALQLLRRLARERKLIICDHPQLRSQLTTLKARLMPSGRIRYETGGLDFASALITFAHAVVAGDIRLERGPTTHIHVPGRGAGDSRWSDMPGRGF